MLTTRAVIVRCGRTGCGIVTGHERRLGIGPSNRGAGIRARWVCRACRRAASDSCYLALTAQYRRQCGLTGPVRCRIRERLNPRRELCENCYRRELVSVPPPTPLPKR